MDAAPENRSLLLIVAGPAGSGKTTLRERLIRTFEPALQRVVTATTRPRRSGETDGVDYYFLSEEAFAEKQRDDGFYECAVVHGRYSYGAPKEEIAGKLGAGTDLIMNVDVAGAAHYRAIAATDPVLCDRLVTVFIKPRDLDQLRSRLQRRDPGRDDEIARRIRTAESEIEQWRQFDYCFISTSKSKDFQLLKAIYTAEKLRTPRG